MVEKTSKRKRGLRTYSVYVQALKGSPLLPKEVEGIPEEVEAKNLTEAIIIALSDIKLLSTKERNQLYNLDITELER